jgi:hypothetical protein
LSRQTASASTARRIAASLIRPDAESPSPRRMMREDGAWGEGSADGGGQAVLS